MQKISLDQLIGEVKPVAELTYEGKVIPIFPPEDLPEKYYLRYKEASAKMAEVIEMIAPDLAKEQVQQMIGASAETRIVQVDDSEIAETAKELSSLSTVVRSQKLQSTAFREWVEAVMQLPPESLSKIPASVIAEMYGILTMSIKEALLPPSAEDVAEAEGNEPEPESKPKRQGRRSTNTLAA